MTDPTNKTVRGWQVEILNALGGFAALPQVVAELRYLNKALTGGNAIEPPATPIESWGLLRALLSQRVNNDGVFTYLGIENRLRLYLTNFTNLNTYTQLEELKTALNTVNSRLVDPITSFSVARIAGLILGDSSEIAALIGVPTNNRPLQAIQEDILSAIGAVNTSPGGFTARDLLGRILIEQTRAADCCEGSEGEPTNEPPESTGACAEWGPYIRASAYVFVADVDDGLGGDLQTLYDVEFDFSGQPWFQSMGTSGGRVYYELAGTDDLTLEYCHARNFTGTLTCRTSGPDFGTTIADATNSTYTVAPDGFQVQEITSTVDIGDTAGERRYFGFSAQFPRGVVPPLNIWFKARYVVS